MSKKQDPQSHSRCLNQVVRYRTLQIFADYPIPHVVGDGLKKAVSYSWRTDWQGRISYQVGGSVLTISKAKRETSITLYLPRKTIEILRFNVDGLPIRKRPRRRNNTRSNSIPILDSNCLLCITFLKSALWIVFDHSKEIVFGLVTYPI